MCWKKLFIRWLWKQNIYPSVYTYIYIYYIDNRVTVSTFWYWNCFGFWYDVDGRCMIMFCWPTCHDMDVKIHERLVNSWANDGASAWFCLLHGAIILHLWLTSSRSSTMQLSSRPCQRKPSHQSCAMDHSSRCWGVARTFTHTGGRVKGIQSQNPQIGSNFMKSVEP